MVTSFKNDMVSFVNKDDVLTLLIHLGYLAYNQQTQMAYIPNEEIRREFLTAVTSNRWNELLTLSSRNLQSFWMLHLLWMKMRLLQELERSMRNILL